MNLRYTMFIIRYKIITPYHHSLHRMNNQSLCTQRGTNDPFLMITISKYYYYHYYYYYIKTIIKFSFLLFLFLGMYYSAQNWEQELFYIMERNGWLNCVACVFRFTYFYVLHIFFRAHKVHASYLWRYQGKLLRSAFICAHSKIISGAK